MVNKKEKSLSPLLKVCSALIALSYLIVTASSNFLWIGEPKLPSKFDQ